MSKTQFNLEEITSIEEYRRRAEVRHQFVKDLHPVDLDGKFDGFVFNSKKTKKKYQCTIYDSKRNIEKKIDKNWFDGNGFEDINSLMERIDLSPHIANYITINSFNEVRRKAVNVAFIHDFFIDVDILHNSDLPIEELDSKIELIKQTIIERLSKLKTDGEIPAWDYLLFTGSGLALHWFIQPIAANKIQEVANYDEAYRRIYGIISNKLKGIECTVDSTVVADHARVCRIPGTLNIKNNKYCEVIERNEIPRRSLKELWSLFGLDEKDSFEYALRMSKSTQKSVNLNVIEEDGEGEGDLYSQDSSITIMPLDSFKKSVSEGLKKDVEKNIKINMINNIKTVCDKEDLIPKFYRDWLKSQKKYIETIVEIRNGRIDHIPFLKNQDYIRKSGRECILFAYYNILRALINDKYRCQNKFDELNQMFAESLEMTELFCILDEIDERIKKGGKPYFFSNETLHLFIGASEEEREYCQFAKSKTKKEQGKQNVKTATNRDIEIFKMWQKGISYPEIVSELKKNGYSVSVETVKGRIKRLGLNGIKKSDRSSISIANVPFEDNKIYARKKNIVDENDEDIVKALSETNRDAKYENLSDDEYWNAKLKEVIMYNCVRITGSGGTGKTTLINKYCKMFEAENIDVLRLAPTGGAAEHIGGRTIHSALRLPMDVLPANYGLENEIPLVIEEADVVIIDEIGMCRIDVFEAIINFIQRAEQKRERKIKLILSGDLCQLPPTVTKKDKIIIKNEYGSRFNKGYAFESRKYEALDLHTIRLTRIFRQEDKMYSGYCEKIKYGIDKQHVVNNIKNITDIVHSINLDATYLCPLVKQVNDINKSRLMDYDNVQIFKGYYDGRKGNYELPVPHRLELAVGMKIMTIVNSGRYKNGSIGIVKEIGPEEIKVEFGTKKDGNYHLWTVGRHCFKLDDGTNYWQLPIQYAWAISIHKSQGCTICGDVVIMPGAFECGMLYTALTRVTDSKFVHFFEKYPEIKEIKVCKEAILFELKNNCK